MWNLFTFDWCRRVFLVGRRGPVQAACTAKELREILGSPQLVFNWLLWHWNNNLHTCLHTEPHESLGVRSFSLIGFKHCTHTCGGGVLRERKGQRNRYLWGLVRCKSVGNVGGNVKVSLWVRVGLKISHIRFLNNFFLSNMTWTQQPQGLWCPNTNMGTDTGIRDTTVHLWKPRTRIRIRIRIRVSEFFL